MVTKRFVDIDIAYDGLFNTGIVYVLTIYIIYYYYN